MKSMTSRAKTFNRVLMVPAERELDECIDDIIGEMSAGVPHKSDGALVLIETGTAETARHNRQLLGEKLNGTHHPFPVVHLMPETVDQYITEVCGFDRTVLDMFSRKNGNIGRLANLCSLIAVSLDAHYLHLRSPAARTTIPENETRSALEMESSLLAGCQGDVGIATGVLTYKNTGPAPSVRIPASITETFADPRVPVQVTSPAIPVASHASRKVVPATFIPLKNCYAYKNLFRYFAGPPHRDTPGTESFFMLLANSAGFPVRTIEQLPLIEIPGANAPRSLQTIPAGHDPAAISQRQNRDSKTTENFARSYAILFARYIDFTTVYSLLTDFKPLLKLSPTTYIADALHALADKALGMVDHRKSQLLSFADSLDAPGNSSNRHAAAAVKDAIPAILSSNYRQIKNHAFLQKQWKRLVGYAAGQEIAVGV